MNPKEVVDALSLEAKIEPQFTELGKALFLSRTVQSHDSFYLTCNLDRCLFYLKLPKHIVATTIGIPNKR
jgi:hypothetical protein